MTSRLALPAALMGFALAGASSAGCVPYACPLACSEISGAIAVNGRNPDTGETGGMDQSEVCSRPEITGAFTCADCRDAIASLYRIQSDNMVCQCPREGDLVFVVDEDCAFDQREPDPLTCAELDSPSYDARLETCFGS